MRKLLILLVLCCFSCGEDKNKNKEATDMPAPRLTESSTICFLSTGKEFQSGNNTLRDSSILKLKIKGELVTGTFNWIPAEKDSRKGTINAIKNGDGIQGSYYYTQEGIQDTIDIKINLFEANAVVSTMTNSGEEMRMEVEKVDCQE